MLQIQQPVCHAADTAACLSCCRYSSLFVMLQIQQPVCHAAAPAIAIAVYSSLFVMQQQQQ
jgi:hypothetical protein